MRSAEFDQSDSEALRFGCFQAFGAPRIYRSAKRPDSEVRASHHLPIALTDESASSLTIFYIVEMITHSNGRSASPLEISAKIIRYNP